MRRVIVLASVCVLCAADEDLSAVAAAEAVVEDDKGGTRTVAQAVRHGDKIWEPLRIASDNYARVTPHTAKRIVDVLVGVRTEAAIIEAELLFRRKDPLLKAVGATALARLGAPNKAEVRTFVIRLLRERVRTGVVGAIRGETEIRLALQAASAVGDEEMVDVLADVVASDVRRVFHVDVCSAMASVGSTKALDRLRGYLSEWDLEYAAAAMHALVYCERADAIPLAIERLPALPTARADAIARELQLATGQLYGPDRRAWNGWWESVGTRFDIRSGVSAGVARQKDREHLRMLATAMAMSGDVPRAGGAVDVYAVAGRVPLSSFRSERLGTGPTETQVREGDYSTFPWERYKGTRQLKQPEPLPLLWETKPDDGGMRLVAMSDGTVRYWDTPTLEAALRD